MEKELLPHFQSNGPIKMENIEEEFLLLLQKLSEKISRADVENVKELIQHQECGVALEILCSQLFENDVKIDREEFNAIRELSELLNVDISSYQFN